MVATNRKAEELKVKIDCEKDQLLKTDLILDLVEDCIEKGDFKLSIAISKEYSSFVSKSTDQKKYAKFLNSLAQAYFYASNLDKALKIYLEIVDIYYKLDEKKEIVGIFNNISGIFFVRKQIKKCVEYLKKGIEIIEKEDDKEPIIQIYTNLSNVYLNTQENGKALEALEKAIYYSEILKVEESRKYHLYINMAELYFVKGKEAMAFNILEKAVNIARNNDNSFRIAVSLRLKASFLSRQGKFQEAVETLKPVLSLVFDESNVVLKSSIYLELSEYYENLKDFKNAEYYLYNHLELYFKINEKKLEESTIALEEKFDNIINQKEKELYRIKNIDLQKALKKMEDTYDKLKKTQQEKINKEKINTFLATLVTANHEINQPLMIIEGNLEIMNSKISTNELIDSNFSVAYNSIKEISSILNKMNSDKAEVY